MCTRVGIYITFTSTILLLLLGMLQSAASTFFCHVYMSMACDGFGSCIGDTAQVIIILLQGVASFQFVGRNYGLCFALEDRGSCSKSDNRILLDDHAVIPQLLKFVATHDTSISTDRNTP